MLIFFHNFDLAAQNIGNIAMIARHAAKYQELIYLLSDLPAHKGAFNIK